MNYWQRFKNWLIKKLGGWTDSEYGVMRDDLKSAIKMRDTTFDDLVQTKNALEQLSKSHSALSSLHMRLAEEYKDCRDTLAGLQILKTKIETFRAEAAVPKMMRSEKELKREVENKTQKALLSLYNDILSQKRFIVVDVRDKGNKFEITATVSVLEGGVINEGTQLSENAGGAGDSQEGGEAPQND